MAEIKVSQNIRPNCNYRKGCEKLSNFHGFGLDLCWGCYAEFMKTWLESSDTPVVSQQFSLDFGGSQ